MILPARLLAGLLATTLCGHAAAQLTVTLTPDRDNTLYDDFSGATSNGAGDRFFAGKTISDFDRRGLLRFDVAGIVPAGSSIQSAELVLEVVMSRSGAQPLTVTTHRVQADWGEGTSFGTRGQGAGAPATPGDATWLNTFYPGATWQNPGGDFTATASATAIAPLTGSFRFASTTTAVADVQSWLDNPATNFGWLVQGDPTAIGDARAFASREDFNQAVQPQLVLTLFAPPGGFTNFGQGCPGPTGVRGLIGTMGRLPRIGDSQFRLLARLDSATVLPAISFATGRLPSAFPLFGCELWLDPSQLLLAVPLDANAGVNLPIPNRLDLFGAVLYAQGVAIDAFSALPITTDAIELQIGG